MLGVKNNINAMRGARRIVGQRRKNNEEIVTNEFAVFC
ncbi:hypothetical protein IGI58_003634 [Enterococcus sp. AZ020]